MTHPITLHFNSVEPIHSDEHMADICAHMEAAGFHIGLQLDSAETSIADRRKAPRHVDYGGGFRAAA